MEISQLRHPRGGENDTRHSIGTCIRASFGILVNFHHDFALADVHAHHEKHTRSQTERLSLDSLVVPRYFCNIQIWLDFLEKRLFSHAARAPWGPYKCRGASYDTCYHCASHVNEWRSLAKRQWRVCNCGTLVAVHVKMTPINLSAGARVIHPLQC